MSNQANQYFADHASSASEVQRLGRISQVYDTWTQQQFLAAGLTTGHAVAEIGFGTGSMIRWLSQQVGPTGIVHGHDLTSRFLLDRAYFEKLDQVEIVTHNIQETPLPEPQYDFVYTRLVLAHLFDPALAIANMLSGLKPGGKLIALDYDSLVVHAPGNSKQAQEFNHAVQIINQEIGEQGLISARYGAEMASQMREAGLIDIGNQVLERHYVGGDFGALLSADGIDLLGQARPETAQQAQIIAAAMRTPGFAYRDTDMHCAIGVKV